MAHRLPDPLHAHGAWVYLAASTIAGTLTGAREGIARALLAGAGFAGIFLLASAVAVQHLRPRLLRSVLGLLLAASAPAGALLLGGDLLFLAFGLVAVVPAAAAGYLGERLGYRSPPALAFAVTSLVVAAPASACAGGATPLRAWLLLLLLAPFFTWRTLRIRSRIQEGRRWSRPRLRTQGWREALYAIAWTGLSVLAIHLLV